MKAVITDLPFITKGLMEGIFQSHGIEMELLQSQNPDTIIEHSRDADALLAVMARIDSRIINQLERCKIIIRLGVGWDTIDVDAATAKGIMVANTPDFCTHEVSDHAMALLLTVGRKVLEGRNAVANGLWFPKAIDGSAFHRISGQTLGLLGFGRIACMVAKKAQAFGLRCIAFDPYVSREEMAQNDVEKVEKKELLERSDFLSLHTPLTKETENAIGLDEFRLMKRTAWLINTSRGAIIRENDLIVALDEKLIAGAAVDVLAKEPPDPQHPLLHRANVIVTPHMGTSSVEGRTDVQVKGAEEAVRALKEGRPRNLVNPEVFSFAKR